MTAPQHLKRGSRECDGLAVADVRVIRRIREIRVPVAMFSALVVATSCRDATGPEYAVDLSLTDSVVARRSQNEVSVIIQVRARNLDPRPVYYPQCGHALQRRVGDTWRVMRLESCVASTSYSQELKSAETRLFTLMGRAATTSADWPATSTAGEYRVVLWLTAAPNNTYGIPIRPLALTSRVTPVFSIREVVIAP